MNERHLASAQEILKSARYITVATVSEDGRPWNTPVSPTLDEELRFTWGSSPDNEHSKNIRANGRAFVVIYDTTAPEGTGEAVYLSGRAEEVGEDNDSIRLYRFTPEEAWINDEAKREDGTYKHDIRVPLNLAALKEAVRA